MGDEQAAAGEGVLNFTEINLIDKKKKLPKRLVYFSDGVLEEYSSEDEMDATNDDTQPLIDPKTLSWLPYIGYLMWWLGYRTLGVCDYLGENLAWFLGITSPKFQYELEQYQKMAKEEEELAKHTAAENAGWTQDAKDNVCKKQPQLEDKLSSSDALAVTIEDPSQPKSISQSPKF